MHPSLWLCAALAFGPPALSITKVDERPARQPSAALDQEILDLEALVVAEPRERAHRFALVRALIDAGRLDEALVAAQAWREVDAYNLVVVRLIGDIQSELSHAPEALRTYSAVTELLAEDPEAQRALATILEARGDFASASARLEVALALRPDDLRLSFELADVALRLGDHQKASERFTAIIADPRATESLRYPAKQRLGQIYAARRREASSEGERAEWSQKIAALELSGGSDNDIKVYLSWDTDRTDVDLWVINPGKTKVFYGHKQDGFGGTLYDDVTTGYGPESFTAPEARKGTYAIEVNYYASSGGGMKEARGEVLVVLHEGRENEEQHVFNYVLPKVGDTVRVAEIGVQ